MVYNLYKYIGYGEETEKKTGSDHIENYHEGDLKYCFFLHQVLSLLRGTEEKHMDKQHVISDSDTDWIGGDDSRSVTQRSH